MDRDLRVAKTIVWLDVRSPNVASVRLASFTHPFDPRMEPTAMTIADKMQTVRVNLAERGYDIEIGTETLSSIGEFCTQRARVTHAVVITDARVERPHAELVVQGLTSSGVDVDLLVVPSGEDSKCIDVANQLWEKLFAIGADRKTVIVAVGGGMVGDLAGFVAATYTRGLSLFQIPTTLLAQVDSAVGGKVGINLPQGKNMVGAFWQPRGVLIDTNTLKTLPDREYRSGLAEVVKYGMIMDAEFFGYLEKNASKLLDRRHDVLEYIVGRCCQLKADVVSADEREESGQRVILNYGHTFCHALEAITNYGTYLHGEAVSIGMVCAARLAKRLGKVDAMLVKRQHDLLAALGLPVTLLDVDHESMLTAMMHDKKVEHGKLRFVLPTKIGHVELVGDVDQADVRAALN